MRPRAATGADDAILAAECVDKMVVACLERVCTTLIGGVDDYFVCHVAFIRFRYFEVNDILSRTDDR